MMRLFRLLFIIVFIIVHIPMEACTIVAISGSATVDGRPLLLKNRDSNWPNVRMKIAQGSLYTYLCQCNAPDSYALSGYNETGFAIVNSQSCNMPNSDASQNTYIMQLALGSCATVDEFESLLNSLPKPINVAVNYGVMDAQGNVAVIEVDAYNHVRYNVDDSDHGYIVRANHSLSQDTTGMYLNHPTSHHRYLIANNYMEDIFEANGYFTKENLFDLTRWLVNSDGIDLRDFAPIDENTYTPIDYRYRIPRYKSDSGIIIQGLLPNESPNLTVAWTMVGPPMTTVTIPFILTSGKVLPQKAKLGSNGFSWLSYNGLQLKNSMFINDVTINLAKLYNLSETGNLQKICRIEEEILCRGNELMNLMRNTGLSNNDVATYYAWVDYYLEEQYNLFFPNTTITIINADDNAEVGEIEYYDLLGRRVLNVPANAVLKRSGNKAIIIN